MALSVQFNVVVDPVTPLNIKAVGANATCGVKVKNLFAKLAICTLAANVFVVVAVVFVVWVGVVPTVINAEEFTVLLELWNIDLVTLEVLEFNILPYKNSKTPVLSFRTNCILPEVVLSVHWA